MQCSERQGRIAVEFAALMQQVQSSDLAENGSAKGASPVAAPPAGAEKSLSTGSMTRSNTQPMVNADYAR